VDGHPDLLREIQREIATQDGRITFARFMELALYHPQYGYYTSGRERIGKQGDYFTSVSVGSLFGKLLARQFAQFRKELGEPREFSVVEFGGHGGQLRADVWAAIPDLSYQIIEVGDPLPDSIVGCVFSNEFLDALPVHLVQVKDRAWQEVYVRTANPSPEPSPPRGEGHGRKADGGELTPKSSPLMNVGQHDQSSQLPSSPVEKEGKQAQNSQRHSSPLGGEDQGEGKSFVESLGPLSTARLAEYLRDLPTQYMEGYRSEVNLRALDWQTEMAKRLKRGWIITIDYGYERNEYFAPHHRDGTLLCYYQHVKSANPYTNIGEQDITSHVEFTSLMEHGKKLGLETVLFTDQSHYLLQIGESEIAEIVERTAGQPSKERAAIHQLIHPELMGRTFKVLVQRKG
jgi:SAM-dependent MidA family methyltransferase